jgi:hypothetical protein
VDAAQTGWPASDCRPVISAGFASDNLQRDSSGRRKWGGTDSAEWLWSYQRSDVWWPRNRDAHWSLRLIRAKRWLVQRLRRLGTRHRTAFVRV